MRNNTPGEPLTLRSPRDAVSVIPYLIGFHPADSLVVLGCGGPDGTFVARFDLPPRAAAGALAADVLEILTYHGSPEVILTGYGAGERVTPVVEELRDLLPDHGVRLREALRVRDGRFWSYLCADPRCCPAEGVAFDVRESPIAVQATVHGLVALSSREELERRVASGAGETMCEATERAERRLVDQAAQEPEAIRARMAEQGVRLVRTLADRVRSGEDGPSSDDDVAWLGLLLTHLRVRDEAWVRIDDEHVRRHVAFWGDVTRRVTEGYVAAPASLLAFAAWRAGDGAVANIALDRALTADPGYSMARLLRDVVTNGVPPWRMPLSMTPEQLAEEWEER